MTEPLRLSVQHAEPRRRRAKAPVEFSIPDALERADRILAGPPSGHLPRIEGRGTLVARFALPLELAAPTNRRHYQQQWALASMKAKVFRMLQLQHPEIRATPLPGRPQVRCIRFSTVEPDAFSDWHKMPVDCLCPMKPPRKEGGRKKLGLGLLFDDKPQHADVVAWWEKAPQRQGLALIEVWTG